jgi:AcrR family transcriptional regulator
MQFAFFSLLTFHLNVLSRNRRTAGTGEFMKRTRLSPEARREQLLDVAKQCIFRDGLQQFSLKRLAAEAEVSEPLLFHYFSSRVDLLQQLLSRDFNRSLDTLNASLDETNTLQEVISVYVKSNYIRFAEDSVIDTLLNEPEVAAVVERRRSSNAQQREKALVDIVAKELGIRRKKAAMIALMASKASMEAASFALSNKVSEEEAIKTATEFIAQGFESQRSQSS